MTINNSFVDEKSYTAKQKTSLFKKFEKVVVMRDSQLIDKSLYHFLYQYCGYIAHYNWHEYKNYYDGNAQMIEFLEELQHHHFEWGAGQYKDIGNAMKSLASAELPKVRMELALERERKEKSMLLSLARKHGYTVAASKEIQENAEESIQTTALSLVLATPNLSKKAGMKKQDVCEDQLLLVL